MFKLVIQDDEGKTTVVPLIRDEITIGRKEGNTIRLTERNVSRRHARILRNAGEVHIEDLGSYNGIRVNNSRIAERVSLRVSDQVQIGDYKLYLKAEGVEQVDDARTMPIERVDTNGAATEVMNAVPPAATPNGSTPPPLASTALATAQTPAQLIGNPNRTLVAIADTDPQGRPVATAATVAALTTPVGYGKLCVVSSNFAGKEYELSRPQMIIGRTDENDIVVNHRSISRNHAKLVREPETGRYTISDLQSSNGVRVNGQDYGKVELRRGDVVDLGHVRLRFVEPGEDFVFARDAVITDVPDSGSKKGMLVAIVLGVVVLGAVAAFLLFKNNGSDDKQVVKPGSDHTDIGSNNGTDMAVVGPGSNPVVGELPIDAGLVPTLPTDQVAKDMYARCIELQNKRSWGEMQTCANGLNTHDAKAAAPLLVKSALEAKAMIASDKLKDAVKNHSLPEARAAVNKIPDESVYFAEAKTAFDKLERSIADDGHKRLTNLANQHSCKPFEKLVDDLRAAGIANPAGDLRCDVVAIDTHPDHPPDHPHPQDHPKNPDNGSNVAVTPPTPCNAPALFAKADERFQAGDFPNALVNFTASYQCAPAANTLNRAYLSACKASKGGEARALYRLMPAPVQSSAQIIQICLNSGIDVRK